MPEGDATLDHRGSRRLSARETVFWYTFAAVSYIVIGMYHKWLLTWFLGPAWLVVTVVAGPALVDMVRKHR